MRIPARTLRPGYLVAFFLIAAPLVDLFLRARPVELGEVSWRYGAAGFLSLSLETVFLGLLMTAFLAVLLRHRWVLLGVVVFSAALAVALLGTAAVFALDALEMRIMVNPVIRTSIERSALVAFVKLAGGAVVAVFFTWAALREVRLAGRRQRGAGSYAAPPIATERLEPGPRPGAEQTEPSGVMGG